MGERADHFRMDRRLHPLLVHFPIALLLIAALSRMSFQAVNHPIAITDVPLEDPASASAD